EPCGEQDEHETDAAQPLTGTLYTMARVASVHNHSLGNGVMSLILPPHFGARDRLRAGLLQRAFDRAHLIGLDERNHAAAASGARQLGAIGTAAPGGRNQG